jgi:hypothetical protein
VTEPLFWLAFSLFLVAACLAAVLVAAIPVLQELGRASRSAEKLFDTLYRELPPTLEAIRLTGIELSDLTEDLNAGAESAGNIVKQFDLGLRLAQRQAQEVGVTTQSVAVGFQAAWRTLMRPASKQRQTKPLSEHAYGNGFPSTSDNSTSDNILPESKTLQWGTPAAKTRHTADIPADVAVTD